MATLLLDDGTRLHETGVIADKLHPLGLHLKHFDPGTSLLFPHLSSQDWLTEVEKQTTLELHNSQCEFLKQQWRYLWADLLVLHPGSANLAMLEATYSRYHTHPAPEALYVLHGEVIFGFVCPDGSQVQLLLRSQDFLHIPAEVEHWSGLAASLTLKAVRYFAANNSWIPKYTDTISSNFLEKQ